jgi:hypothetical protein
MYIAAVSSQTVRRQMLGITEVVWFKEMKDVTKDLGKNSRCAGVYREMCDRQTDYPQALWAQLASVSVGIALHKLFS